MWPPAHQTLRDPLRPRTPAQLQYSSGEVLRAGQALARLGPVLSTFAGVRMGKQKVLGSQAQASPHQHPWVP